ncbi:M56 family metallopeptidase [Mariniblastus sp.]|nr:M56 family metallopeptidase [Mariniblastus sp.]
MFELSLESFNRLSNWWFAWMATATIEALIVLLIVGTIWFFIRGRVAPQVGVWLFLLVPLKLLIPIQVQAPAAIADWTPAAIVAKITSPQISEPELPLQVADTTIFAQPQSFQPSLINGDAAFPAISTPQFDVAPQLAVETNDTVRDHATAKDTETNHGSVASNVAATSDLSLNLTTALMFVWAMMVGFLGLRFLAREIRFRRQLKLATRLTNENLGLDFQTLCRSAGVQRPVRVLRCEAVTAPAVHGILRPSIILPASTLELSSGQLRWALMHELSHICRHDLAFILLQRVVSWLFFFHPAIWIANRIVHQFREFACDDWAILQSVQAQPDSRPTDAGEAFLQILRRASGRSPGEIALSVLGLGPRKSCQQRLQRMLDTDRRIKPGLGWVSICGLLLVTVITLPQLSAASPQEPIAETNGSPPEATTVDDETEAWRFDLSVVDTEGKVVPNAIVNLVGGKKPAAEKILLGEYIKTSREGDAYQCNEQGKLSIDFPAKPNQFQILFEMDGYGPYLARWLHPSQVNQIPHKFTAQLEHAWAIGVTVVDEDGNPVKNAEISSHIQYKQRPGDVTLRAKFIDAKTDEQGRWVCRQVPNSLYSIDAEINHGAFQFKTLTLARPDFEVPSGAANQAGNAVTLSKGLSVSGRVVNEQGEPIVGATIRTVSFRDARRAISGEDGRYTIGGCLPTTTGMTTAVTASSPGMAVEKKSATIEPQGKDLDFVLKPSKGIRVVLVDEAGEPRAGFEVALQRWRDEGPIGSAHYAFEEVNKFADENGVWEWKEGPQDEFTIYIKSPKGTWQETPLDEHFIHRTPQAEWVLGPIKLLAREKEYVITLPTKRFVSGEATDAVTGEKIKSFSVVPGRVVGESRSWLENETIIGSDGSYRIPYTRNNYDAFFLRITAAGYRSVISRNIRKDEGELRLDFKLEPAEMTTTQIVDAGGQPVSGAVVAYATGESYVRILNGYLNDAQYGSNQQFTTDDLGKVKFTTRPEPFQLVVLHDRGFARVASEKMTVPQQIKLTQWSVVEGKYSIGQQPAKGVVVFVNAKGLDARRNRKTGMPGIEVDYYGKTNSVGEFRFDRVVPGENYVGHEHVSGVFKKYVAVAGETQQLEVGGKGVPIVGRMLPPKDQNGSRNSMRAQIFLNPQQPKDGSEKSNSDIFFKAYAEDDGSFQIDHVPPGDWVLTSFHQIASGPDLVSLVSDPVKITVAPNDPSEKNVGDLLTKEKSRRKRPKNLGFPKPIDLQKSPKKSTQSPTNPKRKD